MKTIEIGTCRQEKDDNVVSGGCVGFIWISLGVLGYAIGDRLLFFSMGLLTLASLTITLLQRNFYNKPRIILNKNEVQINDTVFRWRDIKSFELLKVDYGDIVGVDLHLRFHDATVFKYPVLGLDKTPEEIKSLFDAYVKSHNE
jgi:hypothetical protein